MAAELDNRCPICLDSWEEASYVMPCLHQFCYACILRWAESKPECPLCKRNVTSIFLWCLPQAPRPFRDDRERPHSDTSQPSQHPQTNPTRVD
uniref:RING-type E3 ubiquitin transferase n=1 Tax=Buteo japonicus TaxID=224669 RepID=A0A8C0ANU9_9AVES